MRRQFAVIILAAILFAIGADASQAVQKRVRSAAANRKTQAPELGTVAQFKDAFQNDRGSIRLVALISPT